MDFLIRDGLHIRELIQVCWDIEDEGKKKVEVKALVEAMSEFKLKNGFVITDDFEGEEVVEGRKIIYMPLWKWLLGKKRQ